MNETHAVPLRVVVVGLGTIGRAVAAAVSNEPGLKLVGGVDISAPKIDRARSHIAGDIVWTDNVESVEAIDVAVVTAGPHLDRIAPTLRQLIRAKAHVISDCAEMAWPWLRHPHLSDVIAGEARKAGVAVLGTGAWPGVISASLPLALAATVSDIKKIRVARTVDIRTCRPSVRRRAGLSVAPQRLRALLKERQVGFAGVAEACTLLAQGLGRHPNSAEIVTSVGPTKDDFDHHGVVHFATYNGGGIEVETQVVLHEHDDLASETVAIEGDRVVKTQSPGLPDISTAAVLVNSIRQVPGLLPGLRTTLDLRPGR